MAVVFWTLGLLLLSGLVRAQLWSWTNLGLGNTCGWKYGGQCRLSCNSGDYIFGPIPCGFGLYGMCCSSDLPCSVYGGVCKQDGCSATSESEFTYKVRCPSVSQTCCVRKPVVATQTQQPVTSVTPSPPINRGCSARPNVRITSRILGGSAVNSPCQWPWMVSIRQGTPDNPGHHICAGVLVTSNKVLTTVGCVRGTSVFVTLKESDITQHGEPGEIDMRVSSSPQIHEGFMKSFDRSSLYGNDIAILTLDSPVPSSSCVEPVCLPLAGESVQRDSRCFIAGWGVNGIGDGQLHEANVQVLDNGLCKQAVSLSANVNLPDDKLCSSPYLDSTDACPGDNGGMLVCEDSKGIWSLFGIISDNACSQKLPVVYTDVQYHMNWIIRNL